MVSLADLEANRTDDANARNLIVNNRAFDGTWWGFIHDIGDLTSGASCDPSTGHWFRFQIIVSVNNASVPTEAGWRGGSSSADSSRPGLSIGSASTMFGNGRADRNRAVGVLVSLVALLASACGAQSGGNVSTRDQVSAIQDEGDRRAPLVDEATYASLDELTKASVVVVSAEAQPNPEQVKKGFDPTAPYALQSFTVQDAVKGAGRAGATVRVAVPARLVGADIDYEAGAVNSWKGLATNVEPGSTYLLYLTASRLDSGSLTITSTLSGAINFVDGVGFVKPNRANPGIPDVITLAAAKKAAVLPSS